MINKPVKELLDVFKEVGIDFSKISVHNRSESSNSESFDLKPKDFIRYAKERLKIM